VLDMRGLIPGVTIPSSMYVCEGGV